MNTLVPPFEPKASLVVLSTPNVNQTQGPATFIPTQNPQGGASTQQAPISQAASLAPSSIHLALPAMYTTKAAGLRVARPITNGSMGAFLKQELDLSNLNCLHKHLWVAGLPQPPRPLHRQLQIGRTIRVTEAADMHMIWDRSQIYLKPMPDLLLCHRMWADYICLDQSLYESALGLLLSYISLVCYPSDHQIAIREGLINSNISWQQWSTFMGTLVSWGILNPDTRRNPRFRFGELRLGRIIWVCCLCSLSRSQNRGPLRYYTYVSDTYTSFFRKNLDWLLSVFIYITIVLTAMQVGLGTNHLKDKQAFQSASWGFTVFSITVPLIIVVVVGAYTAILIIVNLVFTKDKKGKPTSSDPCWQQQTMAQYKH